MNKPQNLCAMCEEETPADRGLLCPKHRAEDEAINRLVDDVDPRDPTRKESGL